MNKTDAAKILAVLRVSYPHSFKNFNAEDVNAAIALWSEMFSEETYEEVNAAIRTMISTRQEGYSPTIGEVKNYLHSIKSPDELSDAAAWNLVSKACKNGYYGYKDEFRKLPPEVQEAVGSAEQLREWAKMDEDTFQSVIGSNFKRTFRSTTERRKQAELMPKSVRNMIEGMRLGKGLQRLGGHLG